MQLQRQLQLQQRQRQRQHHHPVHISWLLPADLVQTSNIFFFSLFFFEAGRVYLIWSDLCLIIISTLIDILYIYTFRFVPTTLHCTTCTALVKPSTETETESTSVAQQSIQILLYLYPISESKASIAPSPLRLLHSHTWTLSYHCDTDNHYYLQPLRLLLPIPCDNHLYTKAPFWLDLTWLTTIYIYFIHGTAHTRLHHNLESVYWILCQIAPFQSSPVQSSPSNFPFLRFLFSRIDHCTTYSPSNAALIA